MKPTRWENMKPWEGKHETFLEGKHATLKLLSFLPAVFGFPHSTVAFGVWVLGCDNRPFDAIPDRKHSTIVGLAS